MYSNNQHIYANHPTTDFHINAHINMPLINFFDSPFENHQPIAKQRFMAVPDNLSIKVENTSPNAYSENTNPLFSLNNESMKGNNNIKQDLFKETDQQNKLLVMRDRKDNSFTRPSIQMNNQMPNRSASNKRQKSTNTNPKQALSNINTNPGNYQERRFSDKSKSFEANDNSSMVSKNSKSPLNVVIFDGSTKTRSNISHNSRNSHNDPEELSNDPIMLKTLLIARNAEIRHLNQKLDALQEMRENREALDYNDPQQSHMSYNKIKKLEDELYAVKRENQTLKTDNNNLNHQAQKNKSELNQQMFNMKLKFEENLKKNMEVMEREIAFRYASDDNESIRYMKERIRNLEATLMIQQQAHNEIDSYRIN